MDAARNSAVRENFSAHAAEPNLPRRPDEVARLTRYQPLVTVTLAAAVGIIFDRYFPAPPSYGIAWILAGGCLLAWWYAWRNGRDALAAWPLLAAVAFTDAAWHHASWY